MTGMAGQNTSRRWPDGQAAGAAALLKREVPVAFALPGVDLSYSGDLSDSWREYFRALPVGARLLDIASGIGAVSLIAREVSQARGRAFDIHSLDQAATLQEGTLTLDGIHFHSRGYEDNLPFPDGYFDCVTGQHPIPEHEAPAAAADLRRVLREGGRARFMFYAQGGAAHRHSQERIRGIEAFLEEFRVLEHARRMFSVAFTHETALRKDLVHSAMLTLDAQQRYAEAAAGVRAGSGTAANPKAALQVLGLIDRCWEHRAGLSLAEVLQRLDRVEAAIRHTHARLSAVCALAVDETGVHRLGRVFRAAGFGNVKVKSLTAPVDGALLGWDLLAA